jgi:predicted metalloprotease with PDZ domain
MPHYLISWGNPRDRLFDIRIIFTAPSDDPRLLLPVWRPGRYLIQNFAANVREWSANVAKESKSVWRANARVGEDVVVTYRYFAGVLDAGSSFLDDDDAYVNPSNLLMMVDGLRDEPSTLTFAAPGDWLIETQLPRVEDRFAARDYDHLIDSPFIAAASMTRHSFVESGARVHLILRHDEGIDSEHLVEPLRAITQAQATLFGGLPFSEYRFLAHVGDRWHGVEHEDSSSLILKRSALPDDDHVLSLCSHELFHAWNVKRIVPAAFTPYDYWRETPTRLLWAMEGITSYYGELSLVRAGVWNTARYLTHLEKEIETLEASPGREHLSLSQASFDAWLQEPAQMHDKTNAWISFYNKGEVVSLLLDLMLRAEMSSSLDEVMRYLWREYGQTNRGLEEDAIERAVVAVSGKDFSDFFRRYVDGVEPLPYESVLALAGISFTKTIDEKLSFGAKLHRDKGSLIVDSVFRGGGAWDAGVLSDDELLAIDGMRTASEADVRRVMDSLREGKGVEMLIARGGVVKRFTLVPRRDPRPDVTLAATGENALREAWLRRVE